MSKKKGKTKKSGMEKRRQDKRHRKMVKRKKLMNHRSPTQITSPHQLEKLLKTLPNLAFDPMLLDLYLDEKMMKELIEEGLEEPQLRFMKRTGRGSLIWVPFIPCPTIHHPPSGPF